MLSRLTSILAAAVNPSVRSTTFRLPAQRLRLPTRTPLPKGPFVVHFIPIRSFVFVRAGPRNLTDKRRGPRNVLIWTSGIFLSVTRNSFTSTTARRPLARMALRPPRRPGPGLPGVGKRPLQPAAATIGGRPRATTSTNMAASCSAEWRRQQQHKVDRHSTTIPIPCRGLRLLR